jgi:hypothetical protein
MKQHEIECMVNEMFAFATGSQKPLIPRKIERAIANLYRAAEARRAYMDSPEGQEEIAHRKAKRKANLEARKAKFEKSKEVDEVAQLRADVIAELMFEGKTKEQAEVEVATPAKLNMLAKKYDFILQVTQ